MKTTLFLIVLMLISSPASADGWKDDAIWHDGLVEKAVYSASRVIYGKPRPYEAIFLTNKEQHDRVTFTKADKSRDTIEVWKHNQIEDIPTPNYTYHYVTTTHMTTGDFRLTRLDCGEMEWCGTSFKQLELRPGEDKLRFLSWSYMPEVGRADGFQELEGRVVVPADSLSLRLRDFDFESKQPLKFWTVDSEKSNRPTNQAVNPAEARFVGEEDGAYKIQVFKVDQLVGTYWMAKDRLHVMTRYESADGSQKYELKSLDRVNYWTIKEQPAASLK